MQAKYKAVLSIAGTIALLYLVGAAYLLTYAGGN